MNICILLISLVLVLAPSLGNEAGQLNQAKNKVLKRISRSAFGNFDDIASIIESKILENCKTETESLQAAYNDMKTCILKKGIFITPVEEYLSNIDQCTNKSLTKTKNCLPEKHQYLPKFLLDLAKSITNFLYASFTLLQLDVVACLPRLNSPEVQINYFKCFNDTVSQNGSITEIPSSKEAFCQKFIPLSFCFTDLVRDNCNETSNMAKFRENYIRAMKQPCEDKEA